METMKNRFIFLVLVFVVPLSACASPPSTETVPIVETAAATATLDPCSEAALPGEIEKINDLMREFDDYSRLASNTPQEQLVQVIPPMQEIRRRAESQKAPACLQELKKTQIAHMNVVIETLIAFMGNPQAEDVKNGIALARDLHMKYDVEISRLLGLTLVVPTSAALPPSSATQTQPAVASVLNPGPDEVVLLSAPDANSGGVAVLAAGGVAAAIGRTADNLWYQVEVPGQPGQKAWVSASEVQVSGEPPVIVP